MNLRSAAPLKRVDDQMIPEDSGLLIRLQNGDLAAFDEIVERFERRLIGYFLGVSGDRHLAEDCAQEVFVRLYRARETYSPDAALSTFLFRIARNYWIDVYRSRQVRPSARSLDDSGGDDDGRTMSQELAGIEQEPAEKLSTDEQVEQLRRAISGLPEIQQSVLSLAAGQGMKYEEVAKILDIPVGTVKSRVHAAVQNLRRILGGKREEDPDELC